MRTWHDGAVGAAAGVIAAGAVLMAAGTATAQDAVPSWQLDNRGSVATARYESGVTLLVRCEGGQLDVILTLVAPVQATHVPVQVSFDGGPAEAQRWLISRSGQTIFARQPVRLARQLAGARTLSVAIEHNGVLRYELDAPERAPVLNQVISGCGSARVADSAAVVEQPLFSRTPEGHRIAAAFPSRAFDRRINGEGEVECVTTRSGALRQCVWLRESPEGQGFGDASAALAGDYRTSGLAEETLVRFPVRWRVE